MPRVDWNLRTCGRKGHITYAPDEPELRDRLHTATAVGEAWRCLRCGDYVLGEPRQRGPAEDAPLVMRGRALKDAFILRLLALERWIRGLFILAGAYGIWRFEVHKASLQRAFKDDLPLLKPFADKIGYNLDNSGVVHTIRTALNAKPSTLKWIALGLLGYGLLQLIEGTGLWLLKRWGEYFAVVATSLGLPLEIYELSERFTWIRLGALIVNSAAVLYILLSKRLFGLRGGKAAYEAQRHSQSLLEVEVAAEEVDVEHPHPLPRPAPAAPAPSE
jgi:uncharacterized membrane protein (DUF2068 family)